MVTITLRRSVIALALSVATALPGYSLAAPAATAPAAEQTAEKSTDKPKVTILATGGTIAGQSTGDSARSLGYKSGTFGPEALITAVPGIDKMATISGEQVASVGSQDMNDSIWFNLADKINTLFSAGSADAVIITHGTDTMEETAFFLSLVVHHPQPVIITGAMRPASAVGADGPANVLEAVNVATDKQSRDRGVLIVMNDTIQSPVWATKSDTTGLATFQSPFSGPVGYVDAAGVQYLSPAVKADSLKLSLPAAHTLPRVEIIYSHSNMDDVQIRNAIRDGAKGIVLAGVGDGNTSAPALAALADARKQGIVVVRASRAYTGAVKRNVEVDDDKFGFVVSLGLNPAKSRILTQLLLANGKSSATEIQTAFDEVVHLKH